MALAALATVPALGADNAASFPASSSTLATTGTLRSGIEFAGENVDGDFSALIPLHSTLGQSGKINGSLLFAEPYAEWVEQGGTQAGLGLGFRHLFGQQPVSAFHQTEPAGFLDEGIYIGANLFLDMAETQYDQRFWQLGIGAEVGTRYLELRGCYYVPLDNGEESQVRTKNTFDSSYDWNFGGVRYASKSRITVDNLFTFLTEGLEGYNLEASALVPGLDRWVDLRVTGGYAKFHSPTFDALEYDSWKVGIEFRPVPAVVLSGMWFENDQLVGDNWLFGISLELPFETANIGDGKGGFWGHIKDAFKSRRRHLAERLSEPARRGALPMQLGTGLKSIKSTVSYQNRAVWILPDGTVITAGNSSGSYTTGATYSSRTTVLQGSDFMVGNLAVSASITDGSDFGGFSYEPLTNAGSSGNSSSGSSSSNGSSSYYSGGLILTSSSVYSGNNSTYSGGTLTLGGSVTGSTSGSSLTLGGSTTP